MRCNYSFGTAYSSLTEATLSRVVFTRRPLEVPSLLNLREYTRGRRGLSLPPRCLSAQLYAAHRLHRPPVLAERRWPAARCGAAQRTARACGRIHSLLRLLPTRQGACVRRG